MQKQALITYLEGNRNIRRAEDSKGFVVWDRLLDLIVSDDNTLELCYWETGLDYTANLANVKEVYISDRKLSIRTDYGYMNLFRDDCEKVKNAILRGNV